MSKSAFLDWKDAKAHIVGPERTTYNLLEGLETEAKSLVALLIHYKGEQRANYHHHAKRECVYIGVAGSGTLLMDGKEYELTPGKYSWMPPGTKHTIVDASPDFKMYEIYCGKGDPQINVYDEMPKKYELRTGLREARVRTTP